MWKLRSAAFRIVNNGSADGVGAVPAAVTAQWILEHRPFTWFEVLHLHHIEFEDLEILEQLLDACVAADIQVVFTVHDLRAMFGSDEQLLQRLVLLDAADIEWVCLTRASAAELGELLAHDVDAAVIPHGYVADPVALESRQRQVDDDRHRFLLFGAARPNRDLLSTVVNWSLAMPGSRDRLHLMMRGLSLSHINDASSQIPGLLAAIHSDQRITTLMRSYLADAEVIDAGLQADALLLPYLWGAHSGQLELAFDLNLLPICSSVGYLPEQAGQHRGKVREPEWFDWSQGNPYTFGERFVAALERAAERLTEENCRGLDEQFLEYRRAEHEETLAAHARLYRCDNTSV